MSRTKCSHSPDLHIYRFREAAELHIFRPGKIVEIQLSIVVVSMNLKGKQLEEEEVKVQKYSIFARHS